MTNAFQDLLVNPHASKNNEIPINNQKTKPTQ